MTRPPVRAAFFDIGNVLLRFSAARILRRFAWAVRAHPIKVARYVWGSRLGERVERGELEGPQLHALFKSELGYGGSYAQFKRLWCEHFTLDRGSHAVLKAVARRVPTYLLSNTNALHYEHIAARYSFAKLVRGAVLSHELGLRKPDPAIYRAALRLSGTAPEETVFVDDLEENVAAARRLGLIALRFRGAGPLRRELSALGLLP